MKKLFAIIMCVALVAGCATAPKYQAPDPFLTAQLAIATTVTIDPELKPILQQAVKEALVIVDKDLVGAVNLILNRIDQSKRYAPLVTSALQIILQNANDLRLKPELTIKMQTMLANLSVILQ